MDYYDKDDLRGQMRAAQKEKMEWMTSAPDFEFHWGQKLVIIGFIVCAIGVVFAQTYKMGQREAYKQGWAQCYEVMKH